MTYIDVSSPRRGPKVDTLFVESCFPEVWRVTQTHVEQQGMYGIKAKLVGWLPGTTKEWMDREIGEECFWGASIGYNPPSCYQVTRFVTK